MTNAIAEGGARPRPRFIFGALLASSMMWLTGAPFVGAHEGPARILVEPGTVNPGGTIVVRGEDLSAELGLALAIVGSNARVELDIEVTDGEGHFSQALVVPYDIAEGTYAIEAVATTGDVYRAEVIVAGSPIMPGEGGGGRDEDGPLLMPLPSGWQQSLSSPAVPAAPVGDSEAAARDIPLTASVLLAIVAFLAGVVAMSVLGRRQRS